MPLAGYRHVIFDWNGTLLDDTWLCVKVLNQLLREHGLPVLDAERYRAHFGFPVVDFYRFLGFDVVGTAFEVISTRFIELYHREMAVCELQPGARELIRHLRGQGVGLSVLSASRQDHLEAMVRHHELDRWFDHLWGIDTIHAPGKTERGVEAMARLGLPTREVVLVGDTWHDAEVAQAMGVACVLLCCGHHGRDRFQGTVTVVDSPRSLLPVGETV